MMMVIYKMLIILIVVGVCINAACICLIKRWINKIDIDIIRTKSDFIELAQNANDISNGINNKVDGILKSYNQTFMSIYSRLEANDKAIKEARDYFSDLNDDILQEQTEFREKLVMSLKELKNEVAMTLPDGSDDENKN